MRNSIQNFVFFLFLLFCLKGGSCDRVPCEKRTFTGFGTNSFVCVCNSTYCDTVESLDDERTDVEYQEFITCRNGMRLDKFKAKFSKTGSASSRLNFTINRSNSFQKIFGFGGAITDAAGSNIYSLSAPNVKNILNSYYSKDGIEYNIMRVPVGGVDFSLRRYTYDDVPNDVNLTQFALGTEDLNWKIPFIKAAIETKINNPIKMFASAWTAPPWMKTNKDYSGNGTLIGEPGGLYYQIWANYYLKFFQAYKNDHGLDFWAMTAQNEPTDGYLYKFSFNAMGFTPESQAAFVSLNLGPTLEKNGFGDIKIMILDDQRIFLPSWPQRVLEFSADAKKYVSGIAVHWYEDFYVTPKLLDQTHDLIPDKFIFATEACAGAEPLLPHVIMGGFDRAELYAKYIIQDLQHWVTGWTDWNLALDLMGGPNWAKNFVDSPIIVDSSKDEFYKQPMFYILGHFSKFVLENSERIEIKGKGQTENSKISYVAFKYEPAKQTIFVILNESDADMEYSIFDPDTQKYINSVAGAHSIKTIVWYY